MTWLFFSLLALFLFSFYDVLSRIIGTKISNPRVYAGVYNLTAAVISVGLFILEPIPTLALNKQIILLTGLGLLIWALFGRLEYYVHQLVEASTLTIILKIAPVLAFIFAIIFFQEEIILRKVIGLMLIIVVNIYLVKIGTKILFTKKSLLLSIGLALLLSLGWTFDKALVPSYGIALFAVLSFLSPGIFNIMFPKAKLAELIHEIKQSGWRLPISALFNVAGYAALLKAYSLGEVSRVTPIATSTTPLVVLIGAVFLKEQKLLKHKLFAAIITGIAIYLIR